MGNISKIKIQNVSHNIKDELAVHGDGIGNIIHLTKAEYDALISKDENTIYIVEDKAPSFGGLQIASGNLYYDGSDWSIDEAWNTHCTYNTAKGVTASTASSYFKFIEMGTLFEKAGFATSDGDITNELDPLDGWRLPTKAECESILTTDSAVREGSTVNGSANKHYALVTLTGVTYASSNTPNGLIIFPDGKTITGKALSGMDNTTKTTGMTEAELNEYLEAGCAFLPATGWYYDDGDFGQGWGYGGIAGDYWSSTERNANTAYVLGFHNTGVYPVGLDNKSEESKDYICVRLVKPVQPSYRLYIGENFICNSTNRYTDSEIDNFINSCEQSINKVTSISSSSTNTQYPSAKCVYDIIGDVESLINAL